MEIEFIETPIFTKYVTDLMLDEEYRGLQNELMEFPARGNLIKGGGGIRKLQSKKDDSSESEVAILREIVKEI